MNRQEAGRSTPEHDASVVRQAAILLAKGVLALALLGGAEAIGDKVRGLDASGIEHDATQRIESLEVGGAIEGIVLGAIYIRGRETKRRLGSFLLDIMSGRW